MNFSILLYVLALTGTNAAPAPTPAPAPDSWIRASGGTPTVEKRLLYPQPVTAVNMYRSLKANGNYWQARIRIFFAVTIPYDQVQQLTAGDGFDVTSAEDISNAINQFFRRNLQTAGDGLSSITSSIANNAQTYFSSEWVSGVPTILPDTSGYTYYVGHSLDAYVPGFGMTGIVNNNYLVQDIVNFLQGSSIVHQFEVDDAFEVGSPSRSQRDERDRPYSHNHHF